MVETVSVEEFESFEVKVKRYLIVYIYSASKENNNNKKL